MKDLNVSQVFDKLKALDQRYFLALLGGALVVFLLTDVFLVTGPQLRSLGGLWTRVSQMKNDISILAAGKKNMAQTLKQRDDLEFQMAGLDRMIRPKDELPSVLQNISVLANEYRVKIDQIAPQGEPELLLQAKDGKYYTVLVAVGARSGYHQFGKFLNRLERERVFWKLDRLKISADPQNSQKHLIQLMIKIIIVEK